MDLVLCCFGRWVVESWQTVRTGVVLCCAMFCTARVWCRVLREETHVQENTKRRVCNMAVLRSFCVQQFATFLQHFTHPVVMDVQGCSKGAVLGLFGVKSRGSRGVEGARRGVPKGRAGHDGAERGHRRAAPIF